ncbi:hypothetical protein EON67_11115 [archaeon]|nr:MAG: hypothetical protein EON67_11115 [archaeon]
MLSDVDDRVIYHGDVHEGSIHGTGTLYFGNGDRYVGQWKDGLFHGRGIYSASSGASYDGEVSASTGLRGRTCTVGKCA